MHLDEVVLRFLRRYSGPEKKLLLGFSGGPDSLALYKALVGCRGRGLFSAFAVAHVDHGWRATSSSEALQLQTFVENDNITWHSKALAPDSFTQGNKEDLCRQLRRHFFQELCECHGYEAVLLAHHADDQAETVLKRLFEGAGLAALAGMAPVSNHEGLILWRPLLSLPKKTILAYVSSHHLNPIEDITNHDQTYLRGRMRQQLIPLLSSHYKKEIAAPLAWLSGEVRECEELLCSLAEEYWEKVFLGPFGNMIDLTEKMPPLPVIKLLIKRLFLSIAASPLTREQTAAAAYHCTTLGAQRCYANGTGKLFIDRGRLLALSVTPSFPLERLELAEGECHWGPWKVALTPVDSAVLPVTVGWQAVWRGKIALGLPEGTYRLGSARPHDAYCGGGDLDSLWTEAKVPAFLRTFAPAVYKNESVFCEFLSGHKQIASQPAWLFTGIIS